ncbi:hypothetical protein [Paraburkholderia phenazinium]|jgi:hypothetical protein|uniref:Uncharacterized protein n=1 Tax=Paraburkholderia phenazinium TaxID=60549 RepID=A0A1G7S014_9BURK|nr:hypothetical protein [Paraburkholderia phenazinium]SDG16347.1 hypothetical protein SAMN05216466_102331 [Paraburkholderia phenazinium]
MVTLVRISEHSGAPQIWGFHDRCTVRDVAAALNTIAAGLSGGGHTIHVMSGTHGHCEGQVGLVATREERFAEQDRNLAAPKTKDGRTVAIVVHDFNTGPLPELDHDPDNGPDPSGTIRLNRVAGEIVATDPGTPTILLAYCCSAGTP